MGSPHYAAPIPQYRQFAGLALPAPLALHNAHYIDIVIITSTSIIIILIVMIIITITIIIGIFRAVPPYSHNTLHTRLKE